MNTIVDYGMGNVGSLHNMIKKVGYDSIISSKLEDVKKAKKIILPGVGSFDNAITRLNDLNFIDILNQKVMEEKIPILCICLGMQLITKKSEEGLLPGLGWIDANTVKFNNIDKKVIRIPHMGWNSIEKKKESKLFLNLSLNPKFYFVHSYHVVCQDSEDILSETIYGYSFVSSIERGNIYATQFHPEKSHKYGMTLIKNFMEI